jgi:hypothetical protein
VTVFADWAPAKVDRASLPRSRPPFPLALPTVSRNGEVSAASLPQLDDYEVLGDVDSESPPTRKERTAQEQAERMAAHIKAVVDKAPQLTSEQISKLARCVTTSKCLKVEFGKLQASDLADITIASV